MKYKKLLRDKKIKNLRYEGLVISSLQPDGPLLVVLEEGVLANGEEVRLYYILLTLFFYRYASFRMVQ